MNIITQKISFGGKSLGNFNGKKIFVPFSLPGETLEIEIEKSFRDYDEGKIKKIIAPSIRRIKPPCPLYEKCGGCDFMHTDYDFQVELKIQMMKEVFFRANVFLPPIRAQKTKPFGCRNRIELNDGGFMKRGTKTVVKIDECPVACKEINEYLKKTPIEKRPRGRSIIFGAKNSEPYLFVSNGFCAHQNANSKNKNIAKTQNDFQKSRSYCAINMGIKTFAPKKIFFNPNGFFQSNIKALADAIPIIMKEILLCKVGRKIVADIYSGCGIFSVFLSDFFEHIIMVEREKNATIFAEKNMAQKSHSAYAVSGAHFAKFHAQKLAKNLGKFDLVFADPPRNGLEREVCQWLCESDIKYIAYLSCNASTQARDIAKLAKYGYNVKSAWLFDFYPQTSHMETFLVCEKK